MDSLSKSSGVSKTTIKKYIEYLETAFLIKIVNRVDFSSKTFKRATTFKVYLINPSMRAALFGPVDDDHQAMGALTETAIFSQWSHSDTIDNLHYARWNTGEVDIVGLDFATQKPDWCVEVKWSDQPCLDSRLLKGVINFVKNNAINRVLVTTKSVSKTGIFDDVEIEFKPSAAYAYILGANILNKDILERR